MAIKIKILDINIPNRECIVRITDGDTVVVDGSNIGLELNPNGTANTEWIMEDARNRVFYNSLHVARIENNELTANSLSIDINN